MTRAADAYRDFAHADAGVRALYADNHAFQTLAFAREKRAQYLPARQRRMDVWEALDALDQITDASDPDAEGTQLDHALQTAESLRAAESPRWLVLTGFVHDLGKVLCLFDEPQWAVVGDTFPVGCAFAPEVVFAQMFRHNADALDPRYMTPNGIYTAGCGLDALTLSWGHDEYLYGVLRERLPDAALRVIRYHSFYAAHRDGAYAHLLAPEDAETLRLLRHFSNHDLYSKSAAPPDQAALRPYYQDLVAEFLPGELTW